MNSANDLENRIMAFRGLNGPFEYSAFKQLSPLHGLNKQILKNIRVNGHYGKTKCLDYIQPSGHTLDPDTSFPQDATAALIKLLFPSDVGLVVNSSTDKINDLLKPEMIAKVFVVVYREGFYSQQESMQLLDELLPLQIVQLCEEFMPERIEKAWKLHKENIKLKYDPKPETKNALKKIIQLSRLLYAAFSENYGDKAISNGYPAHIVERALLCYMMEKNFNDKVLLKPYYEVLGASGYITYGESSIQWTGPESYYTEVEYKHAQRSWSYMHYTTYLEYSALQDFGWELYKECYPGEIEYGITRTAINEKKKLSYSDCGHTLLRYMFMKFLFNRKTRKFDVSVLLRLKEKYPVSDKLINYFANKCTSPSQAYTEDARNTWADVVNNLNADIQDQRAKIRYLKNEVYEIDVGLDNILKIISKLLGQPFPMVMTRKVDCIRNLKHLCSLFSESKDKNCWTVAIFSYGSETSESTFLDGWIPKGGWVDLTLTFKHYNELGLGQDVFECHFEENHFGVNRCSLSNITESVFDNGNLAEFIYNHPMNTLNQKISIIRSILAATNQETVIAYNHILNKWLSSDGLHFAGWNNIKINTDLFNTLLQFMSIETIRSFKIIEFSELLIRESYRLRRCVYGLPDPEMESDLDKLMKSQQSVNSFRYVDLEALPNDAHNAEYKTSCYPGYDADISELNLLINEFLKPEGFLMDLDVNANARKSDCTPIEAMQRCLPVYDKWSNLFTTTMIHKSKVNYTYEPAKYL